MGIMVGQFEIRLGRDAKGDIIYSLFDTITQQDMPGSWMSMTAAMLHAAELELNSRDDDGFFHTGFCSQAAE